MSGLKEFIGNGLETMARTLTDVDLYLQITVRRRLPGPFKEIVDKGYFDTLPLNSQLRLIALATFTHPTDYSHLRLAEACPLPNKEQREARARTFLYSHTNITGLFGVNSRIPSHYYEELVTEAIGATAEALQIEQPPIYNSFPTIYPKFLKPHDPFTNSHIGWDHEVLHDMRESIRGEEVDAMRTLNEVANEVMGEPAPACSPKVLDKIRFLGYKNEEEMITNIESSMFKMISEFAGSQGIDAEQLLQRLNQFINFSKESDGVRALVDAKEGKPPARQGRRKTGESYYCHPLTTMWFYLNLVKPYILDGSMKIEDAVSDLNSLALHDTIEDIREYASWKDVNAETGRLVLEGTGEIDVTLDEYQIIEALTKKEYNEDWLQQIKDTTDPRLRRRIALCKFADRFANLLTMPYIGSSYEKTASKLMETIFVGGQLYVLGLGIEEGNFDHNRDTLMEAHSTGFLRYLGMLPIIALQQLELLRVQYGNRYYERLVADAQKPYAPQWLVNMVSTLNDRIYGNAEHYEEVLRGRKEQWATILLDKLSRYREKHGNNATPPWFKRLCHLAFFYQPASKNFARVQPAEELNRDSIGAFVERLNPLTHALTIEDFEIYRDKLIEFHELFLVAPTPYLGSVGSIVMRQDKGIFYNNPSNQRR